MIYLFGKYDHASDVAASCGLVEGRDWQHLDWSWALAGTEEPNVVMLETYDRVSGSSEILDEMYARSATVWTELDLIDGKVQP